MVRSLKSFRGDDDNQRAGTIFTKLGSHDNFIAVDGKLSLKDLNQDLEDSSEEKEGKGAID